MFYQWLYSFSDSISSFNLFRYITFRSILSFFTAFFVTLYFTPYFIKFFKKKKIHQSLRSDGPANHLLKKTGTPTMGGWVIFFSLVISSVLWANLVNPFVSATLFLFFGFSTIGFLDDFLKVKTASERGLSAYIRLGVEFLLSGAVLFILIQKGVIDTKLYIPFFKFFILDLGYLYILFGSFVVVGCANAVNLTDGLDGLAIVPVIVAALTLMIFTYIAGHFGLAEYLGVPFVESVGELTVLIAAVVAASLGFLWFNSYPAQIFMGDVGSLGLGSFLGFLAVLTKNELLLVILGGVFVSEAVSVIIQVLFYKMTGRRVFKMAPLHHHFELRGLEENKVIVRFWIVSILLGVLSLMSLKVR